MDIEDEIVSRLSKEMLSEEILNAIKSCDAGMWYVLVENGYQYIYYSGVPHNYAWEPELHQDNATINIFDMGKSAGTDVLLKVPENLELTICYNAKKIVYKKVHISEDLI